MYKHIVIRKAVRLEVFYYIILNFLKFFKGHGTQEIFEQKIYQKRIS